MSFKVNHFKNLPLNSINSEINVIKEKIMIIKIYKIITNYLLSMLQTSEIMRYVFLLTQV